MKDTIILTLVIIVVATVLAVAYEAGGSELSECIRLQENAQKYPNFYITEWQSQMCQVHNIEINAPIK